MVHLFFTSHGEKIYTKPNFSTFIVRPKDPRKSYIPRPGHQWAFPLASRNQGRVFPPTILKSINIYSRPTLAPSHHTNPSHQHYLLTHSTNNLYQRGISPRLLASAGDIDLPPPPAQRPHNHPKKPRLPYFCHQDSSGISPTRITMPSFSSSNVHLHRYSTPGLWS